MPETAAGGASERAPENAWGNPPADGSAVAGEDVQEDALELSLRIAAAPERVFGLLTDPEGICLWFAQVVGIEPRAGGAVEFAFCNDNGTVSVFSGEVTVFDVNARFGFTWHTRQWTFPPLRVLFTLEADGAPLPGAAQTVLHLRQTGFAAAPPIERDVHEEGWRRYLERLAAVADGTRPAGWNA